MVQYTVLGCTYSSDSILGFVNVPSTCAIQKLQQWKHFFTFDWCNFMSKSGKLRSQESALITAAYDELLKTNVLQNDVFEAKFDLFRKPLRLKTRKLNLVHQLCKIDMFENCSVERYYCHRETHPITNRTDTYNSCQKEQSSAKTVGK